VLGSWGGAGSQAGLVHLHRVRQEASLAPWRNFRYHDNEYYDNNYDNNYDDNRATHNDHRATKLRQPRDHPS
jgi:hypothetical protein